MIGSRQPRSARGLPAAGPGVRTGANGALGRQRASPGQCRLRSRRPHRGPGRRVPSPRDPSRRSRGRHRTTRHRPSRRRRRRVGDGSIDLRLVVELGVAVLVAPVSSRSVSSSSWTSPSSRSTSAESPSGGPSARSSNPTTGRCAANSVSTAGSAASRRTGRAPGGRSRRATAAGLRDPLAPRSGRHFFEGRQQLGFGARPADQPERQSCQRHTERDQEDHRDVDGSRCGGVADGRGRRELGKKSCDRH